MKKITSALLILTLVLSLCACGGAKTETSAQVEKTDSMPETISNTPIGMLESDTGRAELLGIKSIPEGFLVDKNESPDQYTMVLVKYTNLVDEERQFQREFRVKAYQNGVELSSFAGGSYPNICQEHDNFFKSVLQNGSITVGRIFKLNDASDVTVFLGYNGSANKETAKAVFQVDGTLVEVDDNNSSDSGTDTSTTNDAPSVTLETDHMKINGICVDDSYRDKDNSPLRLVYLFYSFTATDKNLEIDSVYTKLTINGTNSYTSEHYANTASAMGFMPDYLYTGYIQKVYLGSSVNIAATFMIPEGDLNSGRSITLSDSQNPDAEKIFFYTDDLQHFSSGEEIAEAIDPEGYKKALMAYEEADSSKTAQVKELINGYYWWCYVNNTKYEIEFWADNNFEVRTSLGVTNSGTYSVRNGYLFCTYSSNNYTVRIPYEIKDGDVNMDLIAAFDVKG